MQQDWNYCEPDDSCDAVSYFNKLLHACSAVTYLMTCEINM